MPRFAVGDRVQLTGDISRFYPSIIGVVITDREYPASVLSQYRIRLADGSVATFFDFQLLSPPAVRAYVSFDSAVTKDETNPDGTLNGRQVYLVAAGVEIRLNISGLAGTSVRGQVSSGKTPAPRALITLVRDNDPIETKPTDDAGEFEFQNLEPGGIKIETLLPGKRILTSLIL